MSPTPLTIHVQFDTLGTFEQAEEAGYVPEYVDVADSGLTAAPLDFDMRHSLDTLDELRVSSLFRGFRCETVIDLGD
ncbi:hypothetical protein [Mesorhizobium sp. LjNodule214]|uniref:hypothetical protein n=1 Tax=Mesorhizobium sp. LjNodule214 TaxID=3342252 RepID=UPI003ED07CE3